MDSTVMEKPGADILRGNEKTISNQSVTMNLLQAVVNLVNAGLVDVHCHSIDNIFPDISQQHAT